MKSKTPRTDNACETCDDNRFSKAEVVNADFARQLELEIYEQIKATTKYAERLAVSQADADTWSKLQKSAEIKLQKSNSQIHMLREAILKMLDEITNALKC